MDIGWGKLKKRASGNYKYAKSRLLNIKDPGRSAKMSVVKMFAGTKIFISAVKLTELF